jgi:hypothetical protein
MRGYVPPDPEGGVSTIQYAVVRGASGRRKRLPAACVTPCTSATEAVVAASRQAGSRAAEVLGPSKSSEGQYLYYLVRWLGD